MEFSELPQNTAMLLSYINTKLRDVYPSLAELCTDLHIDEHELRQRLAAGGFEYSDQYNKFW